jgi:hypothetical protein
MRLKPYTPLLSFGGLLAASPVRRAQFDPAKTQLGANCMPGVSAAPLSMGVLEAGACQ